MRICPQMVVVVLHVFLLAIPALSATIGIETSPLIVTAGDPDSIRYATPPGMGFDGVGMLFVETQFGGTLCTGSLLESGRHLLTAAHCVTDPITGGLNALSAEVTFTSSAGNETVDVSAYSVHPDWNGDFTDGADLAVLTLTQTPSPGVDRYGLYRNTDDIGAIVDHVGYGFTGTGSTGIDRIDGVRRHGRNKLDATMATTIGTLPNGGTGGSKVLVSDFDNGLAQNDGLGFFFRINDLGLGLDEVNPAPGDSGGPGLIGNRIAAISSFGSRLSRGDGSTSDVDFSLNWSSGELSSFTRVSAYDEWIDTQLQAIPEPATLPLMIISILGTVAYRYSRSKSDRRN